MWKPHFAVGYVHGKTLKWQEHSLTHISLVFTWQFSRFQIIFFVIEVPINAMTTAPAHPTLTSNRLCSTADVCAFHGGIFYIQARQGENFPRY